MRQAESDAEEDASDIGSRVYWLALLLGVAIGGLGSLFHAVVDRLAAWRAAFAGGAADGWLAPVLPWLSQGLDRLGLDPTSLDQLGLDRLGVRLEPLATLRFLALALLVGLALGLARLLVRRVAPEAAGSGVQEIEGRLLGLRPMRWRRILPVKFAGGALALGAGYALGREGPTVQMGGAAGQALAGATGCHPHEADLLVAAGAGAGIAAAFNAPIAGVLFVVEELRRASPYSFAGYHATLLACLAATFITEMVAGLGPEIALQADAPPLAHYPWFLALGVVLGVFGVLLNGLILATLDLFAAWSRRAGWSLVMALALALAALLTFLPDGAGGGEQLLEPMTAMAAPLPMLALLLAVRTAFTLASYAAGAPGGVFAPILGLATVAGLTLAALTRLYLPWLALEPTAVAAAAMAALFTASVRAPLVGVVLVVELTGVYAAGLAVTLERGDGEPDRAHPGGRPLYELLLARGAGASAR
ncbi:MAG: chloride channel protein [Geminicoccaceae bacterium]